MKRVILIVSLGFTAIVLAIGVWLLMWRPFDEMAAWPEEKFEGSSWQLIAEDQRYVMVKSLIQTKILDGLSKQEVIGVLGSPSSEIDGRLKYIVKLGADAITMNQVFFLEIHIDQSSNRVMSYSVNGD